MPRKLDNKPGLTLWGRTPAIGLTAYRFVKWNMGLEDVVQCSTTGEAPLGVVQNSTKGGDQTAVVINGIVLVELGATVANSAEVMTDADGKAVTAVEGNAVAGTLIRGGTAGEIASLRLATEKVVKKTGGSLIAFGTAVLAAGTRIVLTPAVKTGDRIFLTRQISGGTLGHLSVGTITDGASFVINSNSNTETSTIAWQIVR